MERLYHELSPCGCFDSFKDQETDFLKEYKHWFLILNHEQEFLGRSILVLKNHKTDEFDLTNVEVMEKHEAYRQWREAVRSAFNPDKINQSQLGNEEYIHKGHIHWHFVPRYRRPIEFAGVKFFSDSEESQRIDYSKVQKREIYPVEIRAKIKEKLLSFL